MATGVYAVWTGKVVRGKGGKVGEAAKELVEYLRKHYYHGEGYSIEFCANHTGDRDTVHYVARLPSFRDWARVEEDILDDKDLGALLAKFGPESAFEWSSASLYTVRA